MTKIIFSADDYGVVPSINRGIIEAVNQGMINSVEVFPNYDLDTKRNSIFHTKELLDQTQNAPHGVELGIHLTITSGKPLTDDPRMKKALKGKGNFKGFIRINNKVPKAVIKAELKKQINTLLGDPDIGPHITHMSNHNGSLWFFPDYTEAYIELAHEYKLPIRNPIQHPLRKNKTYYGNVLPFLRSITATWNGTQKLLNSYNMRIRGYFPGKDLVFRSPDYIDTRYYGPLGLKLLDPVNYFRQQKWENEKIRFLQHMVDHATQKDEHGYLYDLIEFMFHLRSADLQEVKKYKKERKATQYKGIDPHYFDSRTIEFRGLRAFQAEKFKMMDDGLFKMGSWRESRNKHLKNWDDRSEDLPKINTLPDFVGEAPIIT